VCKHCFEKVGPRRLQTGILVCVNTRNPRDGEPLVVDLTRLQIKTWPELWDALAVPCGLPEWFGRNLDAWWDTLRGEVSGVLDRHSSLTVLVRGVGLFAPGADRQRFVNTTNDSAFARAEVVST